jgi:hypothetical protein
MATPRGYSSYRGRTPRWKIFLAVFFILVIVAAVVFLLLEERLFYDGSGKLHLEIPSAEGDTSSQPAESDEDLPDIIIEENPLTDIHAVELGTDPAAWAASGTTLTTAGADARVIPVKDSDGTVLYESPTAQATAPTAVADNALDQAALEELLSDDTYSVARLSCFRDSIAGRAQVESLGLKNTGGYLFYDGNNENWLDPAKPAARQYLCDLAVECAKMGFDEILLTDLSYPTEGKLDKIAYGDGERSDHLAAFLTELQEALEPYDVRISVELSAEDITAGSNADTGVVLSELAPQVDRIWAACTQEESEALAQAVTAAGKKTDFVPELTTLTGEKEGSWLLLDQES